MSTTALAEVSKALRDVLRAALGSVPVVFDNPAEAEAGEVSLWLYHVAVDEFSRNQPAAQAETPSGRQVRFKLPPLGVNLSYLIAPILDDQEAAQNSLAEVLLALHENPLIRVETADAEVSELVRVSLATDTLDDRIKLWESLSRPYRLSVCYQVRTVRLVSKTPSADAPVVSATTGFEEKPGPRIGD